MADDQPNDTNESEKEIALKGSISVILDFFYEGSDSNAAILSRSFGLLAKSTDEELLEALEYHGDRIRQYISQEKIKITGNYALRFFNDFGTEDNQFSELALVASARQALFKFPHKALNIALLSILNDGDLSENQRYNFQMLGVQILKNYIKMWSFGKVIEGANKRQSERGYEYLFSEDISQIDLRRNLRVKKIDLKGYHRNVEANAQKYGFSPSDYATQYLYIPYWELRPFDLEDLINNIDSIPIDVLISHQKKRVVVQKHYHPSNTYFPHQSLEFWAIKLNEEFQNIEQDPGKVDAANLKIYEGDSADKSVNIALAFKIVKEAIDLDVGIPDLLEELLNDETLGLDTDSLNLAFVELIYLLEDYEPIDKVMEGIDKTRLFETLTDFAVYSSIANTIESKGSNTDGQQILSPFAISRHITDDNNKIPQIPPIDLLPYMVQSYGHIYSAYPEMLKMLEEESQAQIEEIHNNVQALKSEPKTAESKNKIQRLQNSIKKINEQRSSHFFDWGKMIQEAVLLNQRIEEILIIDLKTFFGLSPIISNEMSKDERTAVLKELLQKMEAENINRYHEVEKVMTEIQNELETLERLLIGFRNNPSLINRRPSKRPAYGEAYDISNVMHGFLARFPSSRKIAARYNIKRGGDEF